MSTTPTTQAAETRVAKHTPGPWIVDCLSKRGWQIQTREGEDGSLICNVFGCSEEQNEANAKLIAAAPSLLSALAFVLRGIRNGSIKSKPIITGLNDPSATEYGFQTLEEFIGSEISKSI